MNPRRHLLSLVLLTIAVAGCAKKETPSHDSPAAMKHEHKAPHGGTPVVLGRETYHLELVLDRTAGKLSAYVMDGEMEKYVRCAAKSFTVLVTTPGNRVPLVFHAVADSATGETVGDTALFEATADWLRTTTSFEATLVSLEIRGNAFSDVAFHFPEGNDRG